MTSRERRNVAEFLGKRPLNDPAAGDVTKMTNRCRVESRAWRYQCSAGVVGLGRSDQCPVPDRTCRWTEGGRCAQAEAEVGLRTSRRIEPLFAAGRGLWPRVCRQR